MPGGNWRDQFRGIGDADVALAARIEIEAERIGAAGNRRLRILEMGDTADFDDHAGVTKCAQRRGGALRPA